MTDEKSLYKLTYGLFLLSAREGERDNGCIVNTVIQVANDPVRISVAVIKKNYTCEMIERTGTFNVSALSESTPFSVFQRFGMQSGRSTDKFAGFGETDRAENGILYYTGANALLSARVEETFDLGSHKLFVATLTEGRVLSESPSCTYGYYQSSIKPKPVRPAANGKKRWVCSVCGYVYEGDELPEEYECPLCHHGKEAFVLETPAEPEKPAQVCVKWVCPVCGFVHEGETVPEGFACPQCGVAGSRFLKQDGEKTWAAEHVIGVGKQFPDAVPEEVRAKIIEGLRANFNGECTEVGMYLAMARAAHREGYPEIGLYWEKAAYEEAEHAAKFAELLGELVSASTKENLAVRVDAENGATAGKFELAKLCKQYNLDALHDTIHEMARDEARHGKAFEGLLNRYFK